MEALILVDVQNDFLPGGALAVPHGDEILDIAARLAVRFPLVVATQDWHPPDHKSFADNHPGRRAGDVIELAGTRQVLWPRHCVQETPGAELPAAIAAAPITRLFRKGTDPQIDSYSGFFDNGYTRSTGLEDFLRLRGVTDVYILGLATDYCVKATALDARRLGFNTFLIVDACRGVELAAGDIQRAIHAMRSAGVTVASSDTVLQERAPNQEPHALLGEGQHLRLLRRGTWEFVQRRNCSDAVLVAAITTDGKLVFVEQFRPPVNAPVIELPAGLVSDDADSAGESLEDAARELLEETGYQADSLQKVFTGPSSAGLTDEMVTLFVATGLRKQGPGGGIDNESITLLEVPLDEAFEWLEARAEKDASSTPACPPASIWPGNELRVVTVLVAVSTYLVSAQPASHGARM